MPVKPRYLWSPPGQDLSPQLWEAHSVDPMLLDHRKILIHSLSDWEM